MYYPCWISFELLFSKLLFSRKFLIYSIELSVWKYEGKYKCINLNWDTQVFWRQFVAWVEVRNLCSCRPWPVIAKPHRIHNWSVVIGCISKGQRQTNLHLLRTSFHRVRCIWQDDAKHVKRPSGTLFRVWGMLGVFESGFLIFSPNCCGVKVIFPLSFSHLLVVEVQMRHDPERYVWKPKQACYCFTKDPEKKSAEAFMTGSESPVLYYAGLLAASCHGAEWCA